jgi:uncharacterized membrane protein YhhN
MRRVLLLVSIACGMAYAIFPGNPVLKGGPVGALALLALVEREKPDAAVLALALAFGAAGDVLLDLDPGFFVFGLVAFLLGHLTYITLFLRNRVPGPPGRLRIAAVAAVVVYSAALSTWIVPSVGSLAVPVVFYICAITTMVSTAILARFEKAWVGWGAVLFLLSDSIIAVNKFKTPVPGHDYLIWSTYYAGQCGIALGFLESVGRAVRSRARGTAVSA